MSSVCGALGPHHARCEIRKHHVGSHAEEWGMGVMEIERRPHWDGDLIAAVSDGIEDCFGDPSNQGIFNIIAAVEDWQKETFVAASAILAERIERAEAQVQRVREVCEEPPGPPLGTPTAYGQGLQDGYGEALRTIRAALDGDGDE